MDPSGPGEESETETGKETETDTQTETETAGGRSCAKAAVRITAGLQADYTVLPSVNISPMFPFRFENQAQS